MGNIETKLGFLDFILDPQNPENTGRKIWLPYTILRGVLNPESGEDLAVIMGRTEDNKNSHITDTGIHVTPEWTASISEFVAEFATFMNQDFISPEERARWDGAAQDATEALANTRQNAGSILSIMGRILQVEDMLFNEIETNPFVGTFENIAGFNIIRGIWNMNLHRLEC